MIARQLRTLGLALALTAGCVLRGANADEGAALAVEPGELTRRPELVGREVVVDDRVSRFQYHKETGFDQIYLTRAPEVAFELPQRLRPTQNPSVVAVKVRGVLRREPGRWWVDVAEFEPQPSDLDRLNRAVAFLTKSDAEARTVWARWAEQRGRSYHDATLLKRAREIEGDAIRALSDRPPRSEPAAYWLALAERARSRQVAEPEPSAQAHRGFRAALAAANTVEELTRLTGQIERILPESRTAPTTAVDLSAWEKPYTKAPADVYRTVPPDVRKALDHRLWADAVQKRLERRALDSPATQLALADEAAQLLPDRPGLSAAFLEKGLKAAEADVSALRQSDVDSLARLYRDKLRQPEKARELYRTWLNDQKDHRLSARDAEGRIALAEQYETLLDDRATAVGLLRDALAIDPDSREVADAFRRRNFRKVKGQWIAAGETENRPPAVAQVAGAAAVRSEAAEPAAKQDAIRSESLRGASADEVRSRMGGRPNRKTRVASQGQLVEQWIYQGPRLNQYVNFVRRPGVSQSRVVSYYSLPRNASDPSSSP